MEFEIATMFTFLLNGMTRGSHTGDYLPLIDSHPGMPTGWGLLEINLRAPCGDNCDNPDDDRGDTDVYGPIHDCTPTVPNMAIASSAVA